MASGRTKIVSTPQTRLVELAEEAVATTSSARKHRQSLAGNNFYAEKLARLRIDAANRFRELSVLSVGDASALAEMIETCFAARTDERQRLESKRALIFALSTTWQSASPASAPSGDDELFPLTLLEQTKRGYLVVIARQMNGCFAAGWYDASAVMMRRLLETSIVEAFEGRGIATKIKNTSGDFLQLSDLIDKALAEPSWNLSRNTRRVVPGLRDLGHMSAHGRYFHAQQSDIEKNRAGCRVAIEEFLRLSGLL
jgi:hypothetical protein